MDIKIIIIKEGSIIFNTIISLKSKASISEIVDMIRLKSSERESFSLGTFIFDKTFFKNSAILIEEA